MVTGTRLTRMRSVLKRGVVMRRVLGVILLLTLALGITRAVLAPSRSNTSVAVVEPSTAPMLGVLDTTSILPSTTSVSLPAVPTSMMRRPPASSGPVTVPATNPRNTVPLTTVPSPVVPVITQTGIYVIRVDGTGLRRLAPSGVDPAWAPNGQAVAYMSLSPHEIAVATLSGTTRLLPSNPDYWGPPVWSLDSTELMYAGTMSNYQRGNPWIVAADGQTPARQLVVQGETGSLAWGPNNRIATSAATGLATFNADGTDYRIIDSQWSGDVLWSPNGQALVSWAGGSVLVLGADGSNPRQLGGSGPPAPNGVYYDEPRWAPDSHQLVYYETPLRTGHSHIWIAPDDGSPGHVIAQDMEFPDWSPTSNLITAAGGADAEGWYHDLDVMDAAGTNLRTLLHCNLPTGSLRYPLFSPDGQTIEFEAG